MRAKINEITLDWDDCIDKKRRIDPVLLERLDAFIKKYKTVILDVFTRKSASGNGVHVLISFNTQLSALDRFQLRAYLEDDPLRIKADLTRMLFGKETDRLWDEKVKHGKRLKVGKWIRYET